LVLVVVIACVLSAHRNRGQYAVYSVFTADTEMQGHGSEMVLDENDPFLDVSGDTIRVVRCAFFGRNLHSRMPLDPTPARFKRADVSPMAFLSEVHFSYQFTL
jgi:hypothetical protein